MTTSFFHSGRMEGANYVQTDVPAFDNNPLIEALGPVLSRAETADALTHFEPFDISKRTSADEVRKLYLQTCMRFFSPLNIHLDLHSRIMRALRMGYVERNPMLSGHWKRINEGVLGLAHTTSRLSEARQSIYSSTASYGFNIVGLSGSGKSQGVLRCLQLVPQVIDHTEFQGQRMLERQLAWLKLDCPFDGSTTGLCRNILQAVDSILNTEYEKLYGKARPDDLIASLARVAANHHLGLLIIDEIQRLSLAKSGGVEKMLNFFVQLVNAVGVPVILVGTNEALPLFNGSFSQMRRGTGQGDMIWERIKFGDEWRLFVEPMWRYEIVRNPTAESDMETFMEVLYDESQGIIDLAVKVFLFSQELAIDLAAANTATRKKAIERLTPAIIRTAAKNRFRMLSPALDRFRSGENGAISLFEKLYAGQVDPARNMALPE